MRMGKAHLQTGHASVITTRCRLGGGPEVNKFEQVSSVGHQMPVAGVGPRSRVRKVPTAGTNEKPGLLSRDSRVVRTWYGPRGTKKI